jgi:hypothetical protein
MHAVADPDPSHGSDPFVKKKSPTFMGAMGCKLEKYTSKKRKFSVTRHCKYDSRVLYRSFTDLALFSLSLIQRK